MYYQTILFSVIFAFAINSIASAKNVIEMERYRAYVMDSQDPLTFVFPNSTGKYSFTEGQNVSFYCSGADKNSLKPIPELRFKTFKYLGNEQFEADSKTYRDDEMYCNKDVQVDIGRHGEKTMYKLKLDNQPEELIHNNITMYSIGSFPFGRYWIQDINIFYDNNHFVTIGSVSTVYKNFDQEPRVTPYIAGYNSQYSCTEKITCQRLNESYIEKSQQESFELQFPRSNESQSTLVMADTDKVFVMLQLSPSESMLDPLQILSTYTYLNTIPMWKNIRNGNWALIEKYVTQIAKKTQADLWVMTGTHELLEFKDAEEILQPAYLYAKKEIEKTIKEVAIPKYVFKIVIDEQKKEGIVFVTVNNPYVKPDIKDELCSSALHEREGINMPEGWAPTDSSQGYSYFCSVKDFLIESQYRFEDIEFMKSIGKNLLSV